MGHNPQNIMDIYQIIKRWHSGVSISEIARTLKVDRKTVRRYVHQAQKQGISRESPLEDSNELMSRLVWLVPCKERSKPACMQFEPHRQEINDLITDSDDPLTLLSAWKVIRHRHPDITASYSALKRAVGRWWPERKPSTWRHELPPGLQTQVDYGKVGKIYDPETGRNRVVYAFVGTLAFSRYKFVEFVYSQNGQSFVATHLNMFAFWGGVSETIVPDCLKSGVIKPDLYDPQLNPLYREMAEHYGCFIDPARPGKPKDKGKVERVIDPVREFFRYLKAMDPNLTLVKANRSARHWCRYENGMTNHGTTGEKPYERFMAHEYRVLKPLPETEFELAEWKPVTVHIDRYVQFEKAYYGLPIDYRGEKLWLRAYDNQIELYDTSFCLIKTFSRARTPGARRQDPEDFPENVQAMMNDYSVRNLLKRAERLGPQTKAYLEALLVPHAMRNLRKAMGILKLAEKYPVKLMESASRQARTQNVFTHTGYRKLLESEQGELPIPISEQTKTWVRSPDYFTHNNPETEKKSDAYANTSASKKT